MNHQNRSSSLSSCLSQCNFLGTSNQHSTPNIEESQEYTRQEMKDSEGMLATELNKLSLQERNEALEDIHCVGHDLEETPELVQELLAKFDQTVQRQQKQDPTYQEVAKRHRAYVEDPSFRLKFLRANMHNVGRAVSQMFHFLRNKAKYFGNDCVGREITLDDLNEEDRQLLLSGKYHIQKDKDRSGRVVMYSIPELIGGASAESYCRVAYYVYFNILIPIPEVQMKGLVYVLYDISKKEKRPTMPHINLTMASIDMILSLPIRFSATHYCLKARQEKLGPFNSVLKIVFKVVGDYSYCKVRSRMHYGSDTELQYQLRSHGINVDSIPIDAEGALREDIRNDWRYEHLAGMGRSSIFPALVSAGGSKGAIAVNHDAETLVGNAVAHGASGNNVEKYSPIIPTDGDILLGRGRLVQYNPGNIHFRGLVFKYRDAYDTAPGLRRKEIVSEVSGIISSEGRRFLKQIDSGVWVKSNDKETNTKIAQLFREFRKRK